MEYQGVNLNEKSIQQYQNLRDDRIMQLEREKMRIAFQGANDPFSYQNVGYNSTSIVVMNPFTKQYEFNKNMTTNT